MASARPICAERPPPARAPRSLERRARAFRTPALILKRRNFGEADRLLTLFTPRNGKLTALARGARRPGSRKSGHIELLMHSDLLLARGRGFFELRQAEMRDAFPPLRDDLQKAAHGLYLADLLDQFFPGEEESAQEQFFAETLAALHFLCEATPPSLPLVLRHFELRVLAGSGFQPQLRHCALSGEKLPPRDHFFSNTAGGVVSAAMRPQAPEDARPLPLPALKLLRALQREPFSRMKSLRVSATIRATVEALMQGYIASILERRPASARFLRHARRFATTAPTGSEGVSRRP